MDALSTSLNPNLLPSSKTRQNSLNLGLGHFDLWPRQTGQAKRDSVQLHLIVRFMKMEAQVGLISSRSCPPLRHLNLWNQQQRFLQHWHITGLKATCLHWLHSMRLSSCEVIPETLEGRRYSIQDIVLIISIDSSNPNPKQIKSQYFQMSSGEYSAGLKAGTTKTANKMLRGGPTSNISRRGLNRGKGLTSSKTSQSERDGDIVVVEGRVKTPKRIITPKYKEMTEEFLKLTGADQQRQRKQKEDVLNGSKNKSSFNSVTESEIKNSSSRMQEGSSFASSNSQSGSQNESSIHEREKQRHRAKGLSMEELEQNVSAYLTETETTFTLFIPSSCHSKDNEEKEKATANYLRYCKERIGSDNYVNSAVETFNFKFKTTKQAVEGSSFTQSSAFASSWDIEDTLKNEQKTEFDNLQDELKMNSEKQMNSFMINPFSTLPLNQKAIEIHSRSEIPGAAEYLIKQNTRKDFTKSKIPGHTGTIRDDSKSGTVIQSSQTRRQQTGGTKTKQQKPASQVQYEIRQQQLKVEQQEAGLLRTILDQARGQPSETEQSVIQHPNLATALKYVDIILNNQTYTKQYVIYRNYPQLKIKRLDDDAVKKTRKYQEKEKAEENKDMLQLLFKFSCKHSEGIAVTSADWNPINTDLLAVSYGDIDIDSTRPGYLMFWTLKNPSFPEKIITSSSRITACKFSNDNPNLIAVGTYDGIVAIYDIRKKDSKPILENSEDPQKHSDVIWQIQWISKGKGNDKGESLVSISADGRITEWSMKKGLQCNDLMILRRVSTGSKKDSTENMNFRFANGLSFEFLSNESSMYLASTEEGVIYRCSKSYTQQFLEVYQGHTGPIYKVRCNEFFPDVFVTCSADWTCKLWNWRRDQPIASFQSLDFSDQVNDIEWSPFNSTVFASACKDGRLELWDLTKKNMLDPVFTIHKGDEQQRYPAKTMIRFSRQAPVLVTGDLNGDIYVYRLNLQSESSDHTVQHNKISKLLYPLGYNKRGGEETETPHPLEKE